MSSCPPRYLFQLILLLISILGFVVFVHGQTQTTTVDDTDARIEYSGSGWLLEFDSKAFDKTEHLRVGIQVFGNVVPASFGGNTTISTYFLDDDQNGQSFTALGNLTVAELDVLFYQSPSNLSNGTHTLMIVNDNEDDWFIIDFLTVFSLPSNGSTESTLTSSTISSSTSPFAVVSTKTSPSPSMKSDNDTNTLMPVSLATRQTVSPGAAAGIALSSAIILSMFVAILLFVCHRRRRKNTELAKLTAIDPFVEGFLRAANNSNNNNNSNNDNGKRKFSPSGSPAAMETSAQGMFYPYMVEFFSRSRGPRSLRSLVSRRPAAARSARSAKLNVSPMSIPPLPTQQPWPQPQPQPPSQLWPSPPPAPPPPPPPPSIVARRSTRRNTKFSFLSNLSGRGRNDDGDNISPTTTDVHMGIAI